MSVFTEIAVLVLLALILWAVDKAVGQRNAHVKQIADKLDGIEHRLARIDDQVRTEIQARERKPF